MGIWKVELPKNLISKNWNTERQENWYTKTFPHWKTENLKLEIPEIWKSTPNRQNAEKVWNRISETPKPVNIATLKYWNTETLEQCNTRRPKTCKGETLQHDNTENWNRKSIKEKDWKTEILQNSDIGRVKNRKTRNLKHWNTKN